MRCDPTISPCHTCKVRPRHSRSTPPHPMKREYPSDPEALMVSLLLDFDTRIPANTTAEVIDVWLRLKYGMAISPHFHGEPHPPKRGKPSPNSVGKLLQEACLRKLNRKEKNGN